jgi:hypothetical protein
MRGHAYREKPRRNNTVSTTDVPGHKVIFWHRELPPFDAEPIGDHIVEATSDQVPSTLVQRDEVWDRCYEDLMAHARVRLEQEVGRLGGDYAHVLDESIDSRHDDTTGQGWLHGLFTYMLYRRPRK